MTKLDANRVLRHFRRIMLGEESVATDTKLFNKLKVAAPVCLIASFLGMGLRANSLTDHGAVLAEQAAPRKVEPAKTDSRRREPLPEGALARWGDSRWRHGGDIHATALSPDGRMLATAGMLGVVLWDVESGEVMHRFVSASMRSTPSLAFSPDSARLAYRRNEFNAIVWDVRDYREIMRIDRSSGFERSMRTEFQFSADGGRLLFGTSKTIETIDLEAKTTSVMPVDNPAAISSNGTTFLRSGTNGLIVGDLASGKDITPLTVAAQRGGDQYLFAYAPDGQSFFLLRDYREIQQRRVPRGELIASFPLAPWTVQLFEKSSRHTRFSFSRDGRTLLLAAQHGVVYRWDLELKKALPEINTNDDVAGAHMMPDGRTLIVGGGGGLVTRWDAKTGQLLPGPKPYEGKLRAAYSADNRWAAVADDQGRIDLWDTRRNSLIGTLQNEGRIATQMAFAAVSNLFATMDRDGVMRFWQISLDSAAVVRKRDAIKGTDSAYSFHFSRDGRWLCINDFSTGARVIDIATEKIVWQGPRLYTDAFSTDGRTLVATDVIGPDVTFIDTATWNVRSTVRLQGSIADRLNHLFPLVASRGGRDLVAIFKNDHLAFCDGRTGEVRGRPVDDEDDAARERQFIEAFLMGHVVNRTPRPKLIARSPDGKWLASGGDDAFIDIWEVDTAKTVHRLHGHGGTIAALSFDADGRTLHSFAQDGEGYRWNLTPPNANRPRPTLDELWDALSHTAPDVAYRAQWHMIASPNESVTFLSDRLKRADAVGAAMIQKWITDLSSDAFGVRDAAAKNLTQAGEQGRLAIEKELTGDIPLETRRRLKAILEDITAPIPGPNILRTLRALTVLERIGTREARTVLDSLARGAPSARMTEEAMAAVERLVK